MRDIPITRAALDALAAESIVSGNYFDPGIQQERADGVVIALDEQLIGLLLSQSYASETLSDVILRLTHTETPHKHTFHGTLGVELHIGRDPNGALDDAYTVAQFRAVLATLPSDHKLALVITSADEPLHFQLTARSIVEDDFADEEL